MRLWYLSLALLALTAQASAQSAPPTVIGGEVAAAGTPQCFVPAGSVTYQRNFGTAPSAGTKASVSLQRAFCNGDDYSGLAVLNFASPTSGTVRFVRFVGTPRGTQGLPFSNYSETYLADGHEIVVKFDIPKLWPVTLTLEPAYR
jgi:hypothetical protein